MTLAELPEADHLAAFFMDKAGSEEAGNLRNAARKLQSDWLTAYRSGDAVTVQLGTATLIIAGRSLHPFSSSFFGRNPSRGRH